MKIHFGYNAHDWKNGQNYIPVVWDTQQLVNGHTLLVGMSGAGKTTLLRKAISHILQTAEYLPRIHVFDVHGDIEIPRASSVRFSEQTQYGFNPLRVNPDPDFGGVRKRIQLFMSTMNKAMRTMGPKQEACLRNLLLDVYEQFGFNQKDPSTWVVEEETAVFLTDGTDKLYLDVPKAEKDAAKELGAKWSGAPLYCWYISPSSNYQGAITRWPPKLIARTHPTIQDVLRYAKHLLQQSFLGTGTDAVTNLEIACKAAAAYRKKVLFELRRGNSDFSDASAKADLDKARRKAVDSFSTYADSITTGTELTTLLKYDSTDVLKSVVDRLQNLDAIGIFKPNPPPFDDHSPIWRYEINALSMEERKLFVLFKLDELFQAAVQRGVQDEIVEIIVLDEAHIYADDDPESIINTIAKEARKFGVSIFMASQSPTHFNSDVIASVGTKIVLGIDESFWKMSATKMRLAEEALAWIQATKTMLVQMKGRGETKNEWVWTIISKPQAQADQEQFS
ncbi:hypothetical protein APB26_31820 [Pseudomonas aeruginosa]|uniref:helicase HerA-like domain-containing protein n=1 Tax=Pseudomonas aeruginosa TaxID=287 RepID=UPI00071B7FE3|nr:helicase HerA-like domain-containing protein [Pseudomonas aeruginosa]KSQ21577.1 hypothetical protein APB26_31820 [Pseudomonas aeruginosa]RPV61246.1 DUF853 domain-containing protein [Pseudomonas aeruginosa]